jgi:hypothetical protein
MRYFANVIGLSIGLSNGSSDNPFKTNNGMPSTVPVTNLPSISPIYSIPTNAPAPITLMDSKFFLRVFVNAYFINIDTSNGGKDQNEV